MDARILQNLLTDVAEGRLTPCEASEKLKTLPYEDIGYAKLDTHRSLRTGRGEVIFGIGKTPEQVAEIIKRLSKDVSPVIATKVGIEYYTAACEAVPEGLVYYEKARILAYVAKEKATPRKTGGSEAAEGCHTAHIAVVCAGTADIPVAEEAAVTSELYGVPAERYYDVGVAGIHRLLDKVADIRKAKAIVVVAGMEGALASVVGGLADVPVVAVPTSIGYGASMGGLAALLAMLNTCSLGVGVVNIDNGFGAGYLASMIAGGKNSRE